MNENELKDKVDAYRHEISGINKNISGIMRELYVHQKEASKLRSNRDESNDKCRNLSAEAKKLREKRDELNKKISALKEDRGKLTTQVRSLSGNIKESKVMRDELNKAAQGTDHSLERRFENTLNALVNEDIPLEKEKRFFESIFTIRDRLEAARKANDLHKKVVSTYEGLREMDGKIDTLSDAIRAMAAESEVYHKQAIEIYRQVDEIRKQADESHKKLVEKYAVMDPLREKISGLKEKIIALESEMAPYSQELDGIRAMKEAERKVQKASEVKEKLKSSKRISFDDFKALIEVEELGKGGGVSGG